MVIIVPVGLPYLQGSLLKAGCLSEMSYSLCSDTVGMEVFSS